MIPKTERNSCYINDLRRFVLLGHYARYARSRWFNAKGKAFNRFEAVKGGRTKPGRWGLTYEQRKSRKGAQRANVAVARQLLGLIFSLPRRGKRFSLGTEILV